MTKQTIGTSEIVLCTIEVASIIELSEASGRVAAGLFSLYQIHTPTIDTLVAGMPWST